MTTKPPNPWSGELRTISSRLDRLQRLAHEQGQSDIGAAIETACFLVGGAAETPMTDPFKGILSEREEP